MWYFEKSVTSEYYMKIYVIAISDRVRYDNTALVLFSFISEGNDKL